jgi:hypothetical protein
MTDSGPLFNSKVGRRFGLPGGPRYPYNETMRVFAAAVLAGVLWGCDASPAPTLAAPPKAPGPFTTAMVKIDDV